MKISAALMSLFILYSFYAHAQLPQYTVTVTDSAPGGYYLLADNTHLMILDKKGNLVYYKPGKRFTNFMLQSNGLMSYNTFPKFFFMDSTFKVVDSLECKNGVLTDNHDLRVLPNGHFLMIGIDSVRMGLRAIPSWVAKTGKDSGSVKYTVVQELDEKENLVFEWHAKDHFAIDDLDTFYLIKPPLFDWTHPNAVDMDQDGNILLSSRNLNEITKINHSDGSVMWRFGGRQNQFKFINCNIPFYGQHDIRRLPNGHITLFDNGENVTPHGARALEFELDEKEKIATLKWSYTFDSARYSGRAGNVQRLMNSNTLISFGTPEGHPENKVDFVVINKAGLVVFKLEGIKSYRVMNYPTLPWQLNRPEITCFDSLGVKYLKTTQSYSAYQWSDSSSTRTIPVTKSGSYSVFVPYGEKGFISSEKMIVTDILLPCSTEKNSKAKKNK